MKVAIDLQSIQGRYSGIGVYTKNLFNELSQTRQENVEFIPLKRKKEMQLNTAERLFWENIELPNAMKNHNGINLLHTPAFAPPLIKRCKTLTTVHDLIGIKYENQLGLPSKLYWKYWLPNAVKSSDMIIADSECTKCDVVNLLGYPSEKIRVIYLSGHEGFLSSVDDSIKKSVCRRWAIDRPFFLFVGTLEPRKNLNRALRAFLKLRQECREARNYQFVIVGSQSFAKGSFFSSLSKAYPIKDHDVIFTGYINHEELNALYCQCEAFVFPSLYEGFGIPILEAMSSGAAVIASNVSSVPEVAGNAAYYINPYEVDEIYTAMRDFVEAPSLKHEFQSKGFIQKNKFSWTITAKETCEVYRELCVS